MKTSFAQVALADIYDWPQHALEAAYRVDVLAELRGVKPRELRAFFLKKFGRNPKKQF